MAVLTRTFRCGLALQDQPVAVAGSRSLGTSRQCHAPWSAENTLKALRCSVGGAWPIRILGPNPAVEAQYIGGELIAVDEVEMHQYVADYSI